MLRDYFDRDPKRFPVRVVMVECLVDDPARSSYSINGVRQRAGDKARLPLGLARQLERQGKALVVKETEREEVL